MLRFFGGSERFRRRIVAGGKKEEQVNKNKQISHNGIIEIRNAKRVCIPNVFYIKIVVIILVGL